MLADIELAQTLQAAPEEEEKVEEMPHPLDRNYQLLKCQLQLLDPEALEYKVGRGPRGAEPAVSTPLCASALQMPRGAPHPWSSLPGSPALRSALGPGGPTWLTHTSLALGPQLLLPPAGDPYLFGTDCQQLQVPYSSARLDSEPRRGGEAEPPARHCPPITALTLRDVTLA